MIEEELEKKRETLAQKLFMKEEEIENLKVENVKLKKKFQNLKNEKDKQNGQLEEKLKLKENENDNLKLQFSEGEFDKLIKELDSKEKIIVELKNENFKLFEIKKEYEKILKNYEIDNKNLNEKLKEFESEEKTKEISSNLDILKMKMMFYEGNKDKQNLNDLGKQINSLEQTINQKNKNFEIVNEESILLKE